MGVRCMTAFKRIMGTVWLSPYGSTSNSQGYAGFKGYWVHVFEPQPYMLPCLSLALPAFAIGGLLLGFGAGAR